ncbi:hypothetical protein Q8A73_007358 [Channa argus]|nr:hypothetical protein Q8A73_007358 [Channa argus]
MLWSISLSLGDSSLELPRISVPCSSVSRQGRKSGYSEQLANLAFGTSTHTLLERRTLSTRPEHQEGRDRVLKRQEHHKKELNVSQKENRPVDVIQADGFPLTIRHLHGAYSNSRHHLRKKPVPFLRSVTARWGVASCRLTEEEKAEKKVGTYRCEKRPHLFAVTFLHFVMKNSSLLHREMIFHPSFSTRSHRFLFFSERCSPPLLYNCPEYINSNCEARPFVIDSYALHYRGSACFLQPIIDPKDEMGGAMTVTKHGSLVSFTSDSWSLVNRDPIDFIIIRVHC